MLAGRAIVITGAGRGLGRAFAVDAARHGAAVVANDIDLDLAEETAAAIRSFGGAAVADGGSVCDWNAAHALVARCVDLHGKVDGLVNNAAILHQAPPWEEQEQPIRDLIDVNVVGTLFCGHHAITYMREQRSGSIVNITSRAILGITGSSTYAASKGAVASLTASWSLELAQFGIHVNCVAPHARTRMLGLDEHPGRPAAPEPEAIAPVVTFLLSDRASDVSGQTVFMNGRNLSIIRQPKMSAISCERADWSAEAVAASFDDRLRADLETIGLSYS
jgi:NAD(P)-dependent dehydrogenase (short-subunit alcohol dehydrogenase family)